MHDMIIIIWQTVAAVDRQEQQQLQLQTESNDDNADNGLAAGSLPAATATATVAVPATDALPFVNNSLGVTLVLPLLPQPMLALQWRSQRCVSVLRMHIDYVSICILTVTVLQSGMCAACEIRAKCVAHACRYMYVYTDRLFATQLSK